MMNQPLITVIVPCYNIEQYINKCVSSIVSQTYNNLEILLINDGSTDETGTICNSWQEKDCRIKVFHKQNEGSSYARKTGVENATANYVTFVDADDWIDENMYNNMINALLSTNSDIVQCGVCDAYEDGRIKHRFSETIDGYFEIFDRIKGVLLILEDKEWKSYMVNKIFKKHLFEHIEFPKGRGLSEDATISHILFHHASQTVYLRDEYYFYLQRNSSITKPNNLSSRMKNRFDSYNAYYERYCFIVQHPEYHSCLILAKNNAFSRGIRLYRNSLIHYQYFQKDYSCSVFEQLNAYKLKIKDINKEIVTSLMHIEIIIFLFSSSFYKFLIKLFAIIKHKNNI